MILFDNAGYERFFNPLCCKNKRIYYECILRLIEKSKSVPLLYETDARDCLIWYLRNCAYALEEEELTENAEEKVSNKKSETENAGAILAYFRRCGWIAEREIGRNGDNIATVLPYCRKLIDAIERIFRRDTSGILTNHIFAVYDILHSAFDSDHGRAVRPYSNILVPLSDHVWDLKNELLALKDSIRSIMCMVIRMTEMNSFGRFLMKDEMMHLFFNDYFFLKRDGLLPGYIAEIERMLRRIADTEVYGNMVKEYRNLKQTEEGQAKETVDAQLSEIQNFIGYEYAKEMDYIDKKINGYYNLYSTRILMVLGNHMNMQSCLNDLLLTLKELGREEKQGAILALSESFRLQSCKYVGRKSIERRKKRKPNRKSGAIVTGRLSEEEKAKLTGELLHEYPDRYGVGQAAAYFGRLLGDRDEIRVVKENIAGREDAMMAAAGMIYSGAEDFPYEVEFLDGTMETEAATLSNIRIRRKK